MGTKKIKDICHVAAVKDENRRIFVEEGQESLTRWKEYFEELLNVEKERKFWRVLTRWKDR